jgi:cobalt-zinc-cadmium efflux system outer membrane protein
MSIGSRAALAAAALLLLAGGADGASAGLPEGEEGFTPRAAAEEALRANPELRAAREAIEVARARLAQAGLWPNPELALAGASDFAFANEGEASANVALEQRFPIAGRLARAQDLARVDVEVALAEARDFERTLIGEVERTAVSILALDRAVESRDAVIEAARGLVGASRRRLEAAEVSEADLNLLEIGLARLEQERRLLELERRNRAVELNRLLHRANEAPVRVTGTLDEPLYAPLSGADPLEVALRERPDLQRQRLSMTRAQAELPLARAEAWEDWSVETGYQRENSVLDDRGLALSSRDNLLAAAVRVPLPLWNRNQGRIAEAIASERRAGHEVAALERRIAAELEVAQQRIDALGAVAREYRERLVQRAERNVALLRQGYAQGLAPISALVQAQEQLAEISASYAQTLGELRRAEVELETAAAANPILEKRP